MKLRAAATEAQLTEAEEKFGSPLPKVVRDLYLTANGGKSITEQADLQLYSLKEALAYRRVPGFFDATWKLWPLAENNDSNPICVCCAPPLAGYVVLVNHDDGPRLMYRSLDGFFRAATVLVAAEEFLDTQELAGDFDGPARTSRDLSSARRLIQLASRGKTQSETEQTDALRFAADLLSDEHSDEIAQLLDHDDEYVREHVLARLKRIPGYKSQRAAKRNEDTFDAFVERCASLLRTAGIKPNVLEMYGKKTIRLDPGPIWLNMEIWHGKRKRPDFDQEFVEGIRPLVAGKRSGKKAKPARKR